MKGQLESNNASIHPRVAFEGREIYQYRDIFHSMSICLECKSEKFLIPHTHTILGIAKQYDKTNTNIANTEIKKPSVCDRQSEYEQLKDVKSTITWCICI